MRRDWIVIGASAGGVEALQRLIGALPADLPAVLLVVLHRLPYLPGLLAQILERDGPLPVTNAVDGEVPLKGHVYLAPPDRHLTVERGVLRVKRGPKENFSRPAIDPLFRSAAQQLGTRAVGVILSGMLFDGATGLLAIKQYGGAVIVQDPEDAAYSEMPENAISQVQVDKVLPLDEIAPFLVALTKGSETLEEDFSEIKSEGKEDSTEAMSSHISEPSEFDRLPRVVEQNRGEQIGGERHGETTVFTCPECGGTLWQAGEELPIQFRCHVGHVYGAESLAIHQNEEIERSLWVAVRTLVDRGLLLRQLGENARKLGNLSSAQHFEREAQTAEDHAATVRQLIEHSS